MTMSLLPKGEFFRTIAREALKEFMLCRSMKSRWRN